MPRIDAIDVANYTPVPTISQTNLLKSMWVKRAIVGCSYGTIARTQLESFSNAGMEVQGYGWITHPFRPDSLYKVLHAIQGLPVTRVWLDAEDAVPTAYSPDKVVQDIRDAIGYMQQNSQGIKLGIYTANWWWEPNTGGYKGLDICGLPLWFANYQNPDNVNFEDLLFGGWTADKVDMWQYAGSIETAGLNTDRNLIIGGTGRMYTDQEIDAKIGALLGAIAANGSSINVQQAQIGALARALADHIQNHSGAWSDEQKKAIAKLQEELAAAKADLKAKLEEAAKVFNV